MKTTTIVTVRQLLVPLHRPLDPLRAPAAVACMALLGVLSANAFADPPVPGSAASSSSGKSEASKDFAAGMKAFELGDFGHAADLFEQAYAHAPHPSALWNAARAWENAGELARAANLYAQYLREATTEARDRNSATAGLKRLSAKLGRIEIQAQGFEDVRIDDRPVAATIVYLIPGSHRIQARRGDQIVRRQFSVQAEEYKSIAIEESAPASSTPASPTASGRSPVVSPRSEPATDRNPVDSRSQGLPSWVFFAGSAATLVCAGVTVWSGLDTLSARDSFDGTHDKLVDGRSKQTRTNVLLGVSVGLGVLTGVAALWLVDWKGTTARTEVGLGVGSVVLRGRF